MKTLSLTHQVHCLHYRRKFTQVFPQIHGPRRRTSSSHLSQARATVLLASPRVLSRQTQFRPSLRSALLLLENRGQLSRSSLAQSARQTKLCLLSLSSRNHLARRCTMTTPSCDGGLQNPSPRPRYKTHPQRTLSRTRPHRHLSRKHSFLRVLRLSQPHSLRRKITHPCLHQATK